MKLRSFRKSWRVMNKKEEMLRLQAATGYMADEDMNRLLGWFQISHPIFGSKAPEPGEALKLGIAMGEKHRKHREENDEAALPRGYGSGRDGGM